MRFDDWCPGYFFEGAIICTILFKNAYTKSQYYTLFKYNFNIIVCFVICLLFCYKAVNVL
jgi:hypothetical protein